MNKIKNNKKGFTLAELLIVVAIIGVLVAVSVPIFKGSLDKAKKATNMANVRAAKAAAVCEYLQNAETGKETYYYDVDKGILGGSKESTDPKNGVYPVIKVEITANGESVTTYPSVDEFKENTPAASTDTEEGGSSNSALTDDTKSK